MYTLMHPQHASREQVNQKFAALRWRELLWGFSLCHNHTVTRSRQVREVVSQNPRKSPCKLLIFISKRELQASGLKIISYRRAFIGLGGCVNGVRQTASI